MSKKNKLFMLVFFFEIELKGRKAMGNAKNEKTNIGVPRGTLSKEYKEILDYIFKNEIINFSELIECFSEKYDKETIIQNIAQMKEYEDVQITQVENDREIKAIRNAEGLTRKELQDIENIKKWGDGYNEEDFRFLNQKFDEYKQSFNIRNPQTNNDIITICQLELILKDLLLRQRNKEDVINEIQKIKKTINETANLAKLSESKRTADDYGIDSLSKIISIVEKDLIEEGNWIDAYDIVNNELQVKKDDYDLLLDNYNLNEWNGN